jgi:hypothetical protein
VALEGDPTPHRTHQAVKTTGLTARNRSGSKVGNSGSLEGADLKQKTDLAALFTSEETHPATNPNRKLPANKIAELRLEKQMRKPHQSRGNNH